MRKGKLRRKKTQTHAKGWTECEEKPIIPERQVKT